MIISFFLNIITCYNLQGTTEAEVFNNCGRPKKIAEGKKKGEEINVP